MDVPTLWIVLLSIATPVAGVVGFAFQLRQVKQARLQNEKLELEIHALKEKLSQSEQRIIKATNEEVARLSRNQPMFSRARVGHESRGVPSGTGGTPSEAPSTSLKERLGLAAFVLVLVIFVAYFLFDAYRLLTWVASWF